MKSALLLGFVLAGLQAFAQNLNIDSLQAALATSKGSDRIKILIELCWEYRFTSADTARTYGLEALELARKAQDQSLEVEALHNIGVTHEAQGNYGDALKYQMEALALREQLGDEVKTANTLNNIGIIYDEKGDYHQAFEYYYRAHSIYQKAGDKGKIAMVSVNMGIVLKAQSDYRQAANYYRGAMDIYGELGNEFGVAACHANLGSVYFYLPKYDSSLYYSLLATKEFEEQNVAQFLPTTICNAGMAYHKLGNKKEAKQFLLKSIELNEKYDSKKPLAFSLIYLADVQREQKEFSEALPVARRGLAIASSIDAQEQVMEAHKVLSDIYRDQGRYRESLEEFVLHTGVKDSLFRTEKSKQLAELQTKYDTEKKESAIRILQQENDLKDARLASNRITVIGLIAIAIALLILGYLLRNRMALKQKVELEATRATLREGQLHAVITSQEEERRRFASDLHDGLGQLISAVRLNLSHNDLERKSVDQAVQVLNEMNTEIRNIAFNLMPQVLMTSGITEALEELAARITRTEKIRVTIGAFDLVPIDETEKKIALYRICQEWINNVIKYSRCTRINVQLVQHQQELVVTIEDDGVGFDPSTLANSIGNGWKNINSRLAMVHGSIEIDSIPNRPGTTVIISVPGLAALAA